MRVGFNPEKNKNKEINYKFHRIIIPVYIPDSKEEYFNNLFSVLKLSLDSLLKTIDQTQTNITIINNNCKKEVTDYIDQLLNEKIIDKHVKLSINYGKVYTIISEAKASYEKFITIADADVLYYSNWQVKTFEVFKTFNNVGVVCPLPAPQIAFYCNKSLFTNIFLKKRKGKVVSQKSFELFAESTGNEVCFSKKKEWAINQYYLKKQDLKVCVGSGHFIATYPGNVLRKLPFKRPVNVFKKGYEFVYLDSLIDKMGYYRLSLIKDYVYHLGNVIPKWTENLEYEITDLEIIQRKKRFFINLPYVLKDILFRIFKKIVYR